MCRAVSCNEEKGNHRGVVIQQGHEMYHIVYVLHDGTTMTRRVSSGIAGSGSSRQSVVKVAFHFYLFFMIRQVVGRDGWVPLSKYLSCLVQPVTLVHMVMTFC